MRKGNIFKSQSIVAALGLVSLFYLSHVFQPSDSNHLEENEVEHQSSNVTGQTNILNHSDLFEYLSDVMRESPYPGVLNYTNYMLAFLKKKALEDEEPLLPGFTPVVNYVTNFKYDIEVNCLPVIENATTVFIALNSAVGNVKKRNAIRETWLDSLKNLTSQHSSGRNVRLAGIAFFIGHTNGTEKEIKEESEQFKDILIIDMVDTYQDIQKKIAGMLRWVDLRCQGVDVVLRGDDDIYINARNFVKFVEKIDTKEVSLYGTPTAETVVRDPNRWKMTYQEFPWRAYPNYFSGGAYIISGRAVRPLLAAVQTIPYHVFEDLYFTGLCSERANATLYHVDMFFRINDFDGGRPSACFIREAISWLLHGDSVGRMYVSHDATEKFYNNASNCTSNGALMTPEVMPDFPITRINHLRMNQPKKAC